MRGLRLYDRQFKRQVVGWAALYYAATPNLCSREVVDGQIRDEYRAAVGLVQLPGYDA